MATVNKNLSEYNFETTPRLKGVVFAIVQAEWNNEVTDKLFMGAYKTLIDCGVKPSSIKHIKVPGAFELPLGAQWALQAKADAAICLGCVIQGETRHFDFVCEGVTQGIKDVALKTGKPVIFGVLTDNTKEQSLARAGGKHGNKGIEAAVTAIKMIELKKSLLTRKK